MKSTLQDYKNFRIMVSGLFIPKQVFDSSFTIEEAKAIIQFELEEDLPGYRTMFNNNTYTVVDTKLNKKYIYNRQTKTLDVHYDE